MRIFFSVQSFSMRSKALASLKSDAGNIGSGGRAVKLATQDKGVRSSGRAGVVAAPAADLLEASASIEAEGGLVVGGDLEEHGVDAAAAGQRQGGGQQGAGKPLPAPLRRDGQGQNLGLAAGDANEDEAVLVHQAEDLRLGEEVGECRGGPGRGEGAGMERGQGRGVAGVDGAGVHAKGSTPPGSLASGVRRYRGAAGRGSRVAARRAMTTGSGPAIGRCAAAGKREASRSEPGPTSMVGGPASMAQSTISARPDALGGVAGWPSANPCQ